MAVSIGAAAGGHHLRADDTAGLVLSDIAPLVDRVYAVTTVDQIPALEAAVSAAGEDTDFVAELTGHSP